MSSSVLYDAPGPKTRRNSAIISGVVGALAVLLVGWFLIALGLPRTTANGAVLPGVWDPTRWDIFFGGEDAGEVWQGLLWRGLVMGTLRAAALAAVLALIIGFLFALGRLAPQRWIRVPVSIILEFFRGLPVLLMMLFILLGLAIDAYPAVVAALGIYNGAIIGEALRSGILALPRGQSEAALSLGFTRIQTRLLIEFPQAFKQMLPIIVAQLVVLLKDTSLAYVVAYPELLRTSTTMKDFFGSGQYAFSFFFVTWVIYLAVNVSLSYLARWLAHRGSTSAIGARRRTTRRKGAAPTPPRGQIGTDTSLLSIGQADGMTGRAMDAPRGK